MKRDHSRTAGPSHATVDAVVAVLMLVLGGVVMYENYKLGASWAADGPEAGYFPFYIGLLIVISSAISLYQALFGAGRSKEPFVEWQSFKQVLSVLLPAFVYVLGIVYLGIYVASAIYIALFMKILGRYSWVRVAPVALGVSITFFLIFEVWFRISLPKGPVESLIGY